MFNRSDRPLPHAARITELLELAYAAELTRMRHVLKALECAQDAGLRSDWRACIAEARARAAMLAHMLGELGVASAATSEPRAAGGDCLLEAMELALRNGDLTAAEAIARECVVLAEARCAQAWRRVQQAMTVRTGGATLAA
ncbi:MAG TPA: hypothetical protein VN725_04205 [Rhodanobacteraceae bacterium]|nr:hypothetical protein [Rhodanobacteraceae bacterium]